jgi:hypothetical protein
MSTKNLARTAIEGGRTHGNSWARRYSHGRVRSDTQALLARLRNGDDPEDGPTPGRERVPRWFHDKLGPVRRWLARQVGRPWDNVRADIFARFDTRTTAGRHIVFCHLLPWVATRAGAPQDCYADFFVDHRGLLRRYLTKTVRSSRWPAPLPRPREELDRWLAGRLIGAHGDLLFWFTHTATGAYRQHRRLEEDDVALWRSLPQWFREKNDPANPAVLAQNRN